MNPHIRAWLFVIVFVIGLIIGAGGMTLINNQSMYKAIRLGGFIFSGNDKIYNINERP